MRTSQLKYRKAQIQNAWELINYQEFPTPQIPNRHCAELEVTVGRHDKAHTSVEFVSRRKHIYWHYEYGRFRDALSHGIVEGKRERVRERVCRRIFVREAVLKTTKKKR